MKSKVTLSLITVIYLSNNIYAKNIANLDTLTVTAQKVEEKAQDVPISLSVFNEFDLEDKKIENIKDIASYTPNLMFFDNGGSFSFSPTIRGLRTAEGTFSSSLGMFVDGVPILTKYGADSILMDIQKVEVLKGPQGTLYGAGAQAGVINITTKKPTNETKGTFGIELGSDSKKEYSIKTSGAIIKDKLYMGISAKHYEKDGFIRNTNLGGHSDDREHKFGKIHLRYTPSDKLDISLISSLLKRNDKDGIMGTQKKRENSSNPAFQKPETLQNSLKIQYNQDNYKFTSISTHFDSDNTSYRDFDFTSANTFELKLDEDMKNISQEFRLSKKDDKLSWLIGVNAKSDDIYLYQNSISIYPQYANLGIYDIKGDSYGLFSHIDYKINNKLSILGGLRYDKNDISFKEDAKNINIDSSYSEVSPKIGLKYNLNKNNMFYTTISKGYKPGGFYTPTPSPYSKKYDKETLWSYEIGSKSNLLDNKLILNTSIYYMKIDDMQVINNVNAAFAYMSNAAKATSKGFEFDINYKASDNLELFSAFGYNNTKFDEYKDSLGDYKGNYNPYAPKYNYNIGIQYRGDNGYYARVDLNGYGKTYFDKANRYEKKAYSLVNTKVGYEQDSFNIYLYAKNLFDKNYDSEGVYGYYTIYSEPREIGVQLAYRF